MCASAPPLAAFFACPGLPGGRTQTRARGAVAAMAYETFLDQRGAAPPQRTARWGWALLTTVALALAVVVVVVLPKSSVFHGASPGSLLFFCFHACVVAVQCRGMPPISQALNATTHTNTRRTVCSLASCGRGCALGAGSAGEGASTPAGPCSMAPGTARVPRWGGGSASSADRASRDGGPPPERGRAAQQRRGGNQRTVGHRRPNGASVRAAQAFRA